MARLAFCDYHNMIAILEKYEYNKDFHQIVDFVEASHIRYTLTFNPTVYVSHIRQFWSTARIETTEEGTKILATVDGKLRTVSESSIRRNLKLNDEAGISSLPDAELFENLTLTGYNISPKSKVYFSKRAIFSLVEVSHPYHHAVFKSKEKIFTTLRVNSPSFLGRTVPLFPSMLVTIDEPASPLGDDSQGEACPTDSGLKADQDRANITKTSTLPSDSTPTVTSLTVDEGSMVRLLEDREGGGIAQSGEDVPIKGRSLDKGEEAAVERSTERGIDDTEEMVNVLTSLDAAKILTSGGVQVSIYPAIEFATATISIPTGSGSIPTASPPGTGVLTSSGMVPTASQFLPMLQSLPSTQEEKEKKIWNNETIAKYLQEYHQFAAELPIGRRIELISDLVKYQDNYAKVHKFQTQQRKPLSRKQHKDFYMLVLRSHAGWKVKHFKGMTLEEIKEKFDPDSAKMLKTSEEVPEEKLKEMTKLIPVEEVYVEALQVKHPIIDWEVHTEGERSYWKIIRLGESTSSYQFFVDLLKHFDREDLNQLWALVKETLNIRPAANDKEKELWVELKRLYEPDVEDLLWTHTQNLMHAPVEWKLYDTCGVHHVISKDQEMFMLVENDYPMRKGLAIVMISYKLQGENYSQMANDLILKIHKIANSPRQQDD
uniref:Xylulose kinase-1 n=1 Tax=Tanacetum cinerariifolium TaxID=118510 RepID=A0A6L2KFF9_TANCI|nr:hypothetical protein [Tanacetum cinerariifolium]